MKSDKKTAYDFILRNYREPKGDDPIQRWLPHPENARGICGVLATYGCRPDDLQDGLQDVYLQAVVAFRRIKPPADLKGMKAFCRKIARDMMITRRRRASKREEVLLGLCENPDEFTPLEYGAEQRDPVDAERQLEVLAKLFRKNRMPKHGVDILEGIACRCKHPEIARGLGITPKAVEGRVSMMRDRFRARMANLGMLEDALPLEVIVSMPQAIEILREAA